MKIFRNITIITLLLIIVTGVVGASNFTFADDRKVSASSDRSGPVFAKPEENLPIKTDDPIPAPAAPSEKPTLAPVMDPIPSPTPTVPAQPKYVNPVSTPVRPRPAEQKPAALKGQAWVDATMAKYGVWPPAGTQFIFGPMPASCPGADGCTVYSYHADGVPFNIKITLKPEVLSEYLLFHEIGHSKGVKDECAADNFSRSVIGPVQGHYC